MLVRFVLACVLVGAALATPTQPIYPNVSDLPIYYLINDTNGNMKVVQSLPDGTAALATGRYNYSNSAFGWDYCHIQSNDTSAGYYAAGFLEGWIGATSLGFYDWNSYVTPAGNVTYWVDSHLQFMEDHSERMKHKDKFWERVGKILSQLMGIADGYSTITGTAITYKQVFMLNFGNEIGDVVTATQVQSDKEVLMTSEKIAQTMLQTHCSALIKVTDDDLFVAHDTWSGFGGLGIRVYKTYQFDDFIISMDSFPGVVASGTDWYITSHELAIQETTNIVFNTSLYVAVVPETVSEFIRVMVANYLAYTGEEWTKYFSMYNSGTYNNQYMVVDFKRYQPGQQLPQGVLWVAEQIPGHVSRADVTHVLRATGYWASYNINFFEDLYVVSGYEEMYLEQGTFWSYTKYARPEIFRRNQSSIYAVEHMQRMMRYNDYKADPFSIIPNCTGADAACSTRHSSMLTIASRGDLLPVYNTTAENIKVYGPLYGFVAQGCFGAIDSKIASYKERNTLRGLVISGPTNDQQPTFSWGGNSVCPLSQKPPGTPTTYDFPWVSFVPSEL